MNAYAYLADASTVELMGWYEADRWRLAELAMLDPEDEVVQNAQAFVHERFQMERAELNRRRNLRGAPGAPAFPARPNLKADIERIRAAMPLEQVIERLGNIQLVRRGRQLWGCCPLPGHQDDSPSFSVDPAKQLWHCWGCGRGGDVFAFATAMSGASSFTSALHVVAAIAGVDSTPAIAPVTPMPTDAPRRPMVMVR